MSCASLHASIGHREVGLGSNSANQEKKRDPVKLLLFSSGGSIFENLHVGGVMLGKQVNGCGHW